jgi:hypothetical protein
MGVKVGRPPEGPRAAQDHPVAGDVSALKASRWPDVLGVLWVLVAACLALVPALVHGPYIGSFDFLAKYGLTARPGVNIHNFATGDLGDEVVPWIQAAWIQVHHGHLPLWVRGEALGMPLAFNFGSGAFSFPALISYITPLRVVFWVQILVSLIVGGTGAYFFGRVMRLHPIACAFAGTTWILSGPFFGYLGLPDTSVMSWAGWQFAAVVLILRGTHRLLAVALFAVSIAFSILGGNPQIEVVIFLPLAVFTVVMLLCRSPLFRGSGPIRRPVFDLIIAGVAGGALAAPLILPGLQLANASIRNSASFGSADSASQVLGTIFQTFWGQGIRGSFANGQGFFQEQWVYVGAIALALSAVAIAVRWRRPEVVGLAAAALVATAASIWEPADKFLNALPFIGHSWWARSLIPLAFCLAILGSIGLDAVLRRSEQQKAARWALGSFGAIAVLLVLVWLFGRGRLPAYSAHIRAESFVWPAVSTALGLAVFGTLVVVARQSQSLDKRWRPGASRLVALGIAGSLLICQTVFLVVDDGPIPSSSPTMYQPTPAVVALQRAVGSSLVGLGVGSLVAGGLGLGLAPNTNLPFGINEFAEYDPIAPASYFYDWEALNLSSPGVYGVYDFIPAIKNATVARRYGISYVLEAHGAAGPSGGVFDERIGNEDLYRIPGAAAATLVPPVSSSRWPSIDARGTAVRVAWSGPSEVRIVTRSTSAQVLRLRLASLPGWKATIDGHPLALSKYAILATQARIPAGKHVIELHYWPKRFTEGLLLAGVTVVAFAGVALISLRRRRRLSPRHQAKASGPAGRLTNRGQREQQDVESTVDDRV